MNKEILSREVCIQKIGTIRTTAAELAETIHQVAVSTLDHVREHGDTSLVVSLLNACPQRSGVRAEALAEWYRKMSSKDIKVTKDKDSWAATCKGRVDENFLIEAAWETSPFMLTKEKAPGKTFELEQFLKKLRSYATNTDEIEPGVPEVSPAVRDMAAKMLANVGTVS
jgi:hypothetical protein